jgi:hypothetical protein
MQFTKYVLPVVVGAMSGMILITLGEIGLHMMYPMPAGTDLYDADSVAKYIAKLPTSAFMLELLVYAISSFFAGLISSLLSKRESTRPPLVVGIVLTLAGLYNVINLPQPLWFSVANLIVYLPFTYLGYLAVRKKTASPE